MTYAIVITKLSEEDGGGFLGLVPDLPGCMSDGATEEEALANIQDAIREYLAALEDRFKDAEVREAKVKI